MNRRLKILQPKTKKRGRCSGHCCACFYLPYGPDEMEAEYTRWQKRNGSADRTQEAFGMSGRPDRHAVIVDIHLIYPMLVYLGARNSAPYPQVNKSPRKVLEGAHYYSCKHWDRETGNCDIYEHRPQMCREYPYAADCNYANCTWTERKQKKEPKRKKKRGHLLEKEKMLSGDIEWKEKE